MHGFQVNRREQSSLSEKIKIFKTYSKSSLLSQLKTPILLYFPGVIYLSERLSHACLNTTNLYCKTVIEGGERREGEGGEPSLGFWILFLGLSWGTSLGLLVVGCESVSSCM